MTGRWDWILTTGTLENRGCSGVRFKGFDARSQRIPAVALGMLYSADMSHSGWMEAAMPRLRTTCLRRFATSKRRLKFCIFAGARIWKMSVYCS